MGVIYRYVSRQDNLIKYVGIVWGKTRALKQRVKEHAQNDPWCQNEEWKIEYLNTDIKSKADLEILEGYYINKYKTGEWFNKSKTQWGEPEFELKINDEWIEFVLNDKSTYPFERIPHYGFGDLRGELITSPFEFCVLYGDDFWEVARHTIADIDHSTIIRTEENHRIIVRDTEEFIGRIFDEGAEKWFIECQSEEITEDEYSVTVGKTRVIVKLKEYDDCDEMYAEYIDVPYNILKKFATCEDFAVMASEDDANRQPKTVDELFKLITGK